MKTKYKVIALSLCLTIFGYLLISVSAPLIVRAAGCAPGTPAGEATYDGDGNHLKYCGRNGEEHFEDGNTDKTREYQSTDDHDIDQCKDKIKGFDNDKDGYGGATYYFIPQTGPNECGPAQTKKIQVKNPSGSSSGDTHFAWVDEGTIKRTDGSHNYDKYQTSDKFFEDEDGCQDTIEAPKGSTSGKLIVRTNYDANDIGLNSANHDLKGQYDGTSFQKDIEWDGNKKDSAGCINSKPVTVKISDPGTPPNSSKPAGSGERGKGRSDEDNSPTCENTGGSALSFVSCAIINGISSFMDWVFNKFIDPSLKNVPISAASDSISFQVWQGFRILGNVVLIFGLLGLIFAQSMGGSVLDAYAARKIAPRLLAAAILVNLSIYLSVAVADFFKILGMGIGQLITAPLRDSGNFNFSLKGTGGTIFSWVALAAAIVTIGGVASKTKVFSGLKGGIFSSGKSQGLGGELLHFLALAVFMTLVLTIVGVIVTLILRQGLILLLGIVSPVAVALYVLPSTEKYARQWWSLFVRALGVYPIITAILAIADVMGTIILKSNGGSLSGILIGVTVLFMPLFLIPFAFKFAGGALGSIYGAVSGNMDKFKQSGFIKSRRDESKRRVGYKFGQIRAGLGKGLEDRAKAAGNVTGGWTTDADGNRVRIPKDTNVSRARRMTARLDKTLSKAGKGFVAGTGFELAQAKRVQEEKQIAELINNNGNDAAFRAQTADLVAGKQQMAAAMAEDQLHTWLDAEGNQQEGSFDEMLQATGKWENQNVRITMDNGKRKIEYKTLGGAWETESDVEQARRTFGDHNHGAVAASLANEMKKAQTSEQKQNVYRNFEQLMKNLGIDTSEGGAADGIWAAAGFANQDTDPSWKNISWRVGATPAATKGATEAGPAGFLSTEDLEAQDQRMSGIDKLLTDDTQRFGIHRAGNVDSEMVKNLTAGAREAKSIIASDPTLQEQIRKDSNLSPVERDRKMNEHRDRVARAEKVRDNVARIAQQLSLREAASKGASEQAPLVDDDGNPITSPGAATPRRGSLTQEQLANYTGAISLGSPVATQEAWNELVDENGSSAAPSGGTMWTGLSGVATGVKIQQTRDVASIRDEEARRTVGPQGTFLVQDPGVASADDAYAQPVQIRGGPGTPRVGDTFAPSSGSIPEDTEVLLHSGDDDGDLPVTRPAFTTPAAVDELAAPPPPKTVAPSIPNVTANTPADAQAYAKAMEAEAFEQAQSEDKLSEGVDPRPPDLP